MKVAKLVYVTLATRVIVEENADQETILENALIRISENLMTSPYENIEKIIEDTECPYKMGEEYGFIIGDEVVMPFPKNDGSDSWEYGNFIGTIISFKEHDNVIYATIEDGDGDCFDIEAKRLQVQYL